MWCTAGRVVPTWTALCLLRLIQWLVQGGPRQVSKPWYSNHESWHLMTRPHHQGYHSVSSIQTLAFPHPWIICSISCCRCRPMKQLHTLYGRSNQDALIARRRKSFKMNSCEERCRSIFLHGGIFCKHNIFSVVYFHENLCYEYEFHLMPNLHDFAS
jgi:hypothetical protein